MATISDSRFKTSRGVVYFRRGAGRPVVLVHGWCLNRTLWCYAEDALSSEFDVITPDLSGFGQSEGCAAPYTLERHAEDILALLEEAKLSDAVLVGFAYGAMVSLEAVRNAPHRVGQVIAVGLPDKSGSPYEKMPKAMRRDWPE